MIKYVINVDKNRIVGGEREVKQKNSSKVDPSVRKEIVLLEDKYLKARTDYYRYVIRSEDKTLFSKLIKIPDSWENYKAGEGVNLSENIKNRLSDIKKKMSWELRLQSLYFFYITCIENSILSAIQQRLSDRLEIEEAIDSVNNFILELESDLLNIKHLLLTLAKRSISDFYYLISAYCKFFYKKNFNYEADVKLILMEFIKILNQQLVIKENIAKFKKYNEEISSLFEASSNELGWRMNEFAVKVFFEKESRAVKMKEYNRILMEMFELRNTMRNYFNFLKYYYNETDGKLFRLNFIHETLKQKADEKKVTQDTYKAYEAIRGSFLQYKFSFETVGLPGFGDEELPYIDLIHMIYKLCKILEFCYLRSMKYETLQSLRTDYLLFVEKEIYSLNI